MYQISIKDIKQAHEAIQPFIHRTPVLSSTLINDFAQNEIYFKCENFQKVGAFKMRGASNAVIKLLKSKKVKGVATHSSGNHAAALALSAKYNQIPATIIMPSNAPQIKKNAVKSYGANIILCEPTLEAREYELNKFIKESGFHFIHPYNDLNIIEGQATASLELLEDVPNLDIIMAPVGGGGLISGTALTAKQMSQSIKVFGGEPLGANDAAISFHQKRFVPQTNPNTIADGLKTSLGEIPFEIIMDHVDNILTCSEENIVMAMRLIWERMKIIIEPSCAVPLAALLQTKSITNKKVGIILSGGNVDLDHYFDRISI